MFRSSLLAFNTLIFDKILLHKSVNQNIVANIYLHTLSGHPVFLEKYSLSKKAKIWLSIRFKLILIIRILQSIFDNKSYYSSKGNTKSDILFVSHLTNNQQLLKDSDEYFGDLSSQLLKYNIKSSVALINHIKVNTRQLLNSWKGDEITRFVLSSSLDFVSELKLYFSQKKSKKQLRYILKDLQVDKALVKDILRYHLSSDTFNALRIAKQVANIARKTGAKVIVTTYEGHAWERLVYYYVRKINPNIKCLGYQHAAVFKHQHAIRRPLSKNYNPDIILTSGLIAKYILEKSQLKDSEIFCLGSSKYLTPSIVKGKIQCCLVVPEGFVKESISLFGFSLDYAKQHRNQKFIWRLHPMLSFEKLRRYSSIFESLPDNIFFSEGSLDEDIQKCDSVLYRGSTAVVNAINAGLRPIYYQQSLDELSIDPIYQQQRGKEVVYSQQSLGLALDKDVDMKIKQSLQDFAQNFYTPIDVKVLKSIFDKHTKRV